MREREGAALYLVGEEGSGGGVVLYLSPAYTQATLVSLEFIRNSKYSTSILQGVKTSIARLSLCDRPSASLQAVRVWVFLSFFFFVFFYCVRWCLFACGYLQFYLLFFLCFLLDLCVFVVWFVLSIY